VLKNLDLRSPLRTISMKLESTNNRSPLYLLTTEDLQQLKIQISSE